MTDVLSRGDLSRTVTHRIFVAASAFVLGVVLGHLERSHFGEAAQPVPVLRIPSVAESRRCDPDELRYATHTQEERAGKSADESSGRIENPASVFTATLAQPNSDAKLLIVSGERDVGTGDVEGW